VRREGQTDKTPPLPLIKITYGNNTAVRLERRAAMDIKKWISMTQIEVESARQS
jgi:hypothetical protein